MNGRFIDEKEKRDLARNSFSLCGIALLIVELLRFILAGSCFGLLDLLFPAFMKTELGVWVANYAPSYLIAYPFFFLVTRGLPKAERKQKTKLSLKNWLILLAICYTTIYVGSYIGNFLNNLIGAFLNKPIVDDVSELVSNTQLSITVVVVGIIGPIFEELIYRKGLIDIFSVFGEKGAVFLSALIFGLCHGNFYQFFYAFLLGLVAGYVYVRTGKVKYTIFFHITVNMLSCVMSFLSGIADGDWSDNFAGISGESIFDWFSAITPEMVLYVFVSAASLFMLGFSIYGLVMLLKRRKKVYFQKAPLELEKHNVISQALTTPGMICYVLFCLIMFAESVLV